MHTYFAYTRIHIDCLLCVFADTPTRLTTLLTALKPRKWLLTSSQRLPKTLEYQSRAILRTLSNGSRLCLSDQNYASSHLVWESVYVS